MDTFVALGDFKYVLIIVFLALLLGGIAIYNEKQTNDEAIYATRAINFMHSGVTSTVDQGPLYAYITDLSYRLFGVSVHSSRFPVLFFGYLLTAVMVYIMGRKFFSSKAGVIASFLFVTSPFYLRFMISQPDQIMLLYFLLSIYFFKKALDEDKNFIYASCLFLALAILLKNFAALLLPAYLILAIQRHFKDKMNSFFTKKNMYRVVICAILIFIAMLPVLNYNYLMYTTNHHTDLIFNRFFGLHDPIYSGLGGAENGAVLSEIPHGSKIGIAFFWQYDKILSLLALAGFLVLAFKKNGISWFLFLCHIFLFLFLSSTSLLENHFLIFVPVMSLFSGYFIWWGFNSISKHVKKTYVYLFLFILLGVIFIFQIKVISPFIFTRYGNPVLRDFVIDNIGSKDLVVVDTRIYRGYLSFIFNDKHYLESAYFPEVFNALRNDTRNTAQRIFFVECIQGDCGWGNVDIALNESTEVLIHSFQQIADDTQTLYEDGRPIYRIYSAVLNMSGRAPLVFDQSHFFYFSPVRWIGKKGIDDFTITSFFDKVINGASYLVLYVSLLFMIILPFVTFYYFYRKGELL